jgi:diguanylate cyclase
MTKILIIEDEDAIRDIISDILTDEGFQVFAAEDGNTGINLANMELPDLIICDIMMPDIDGYTVISQFQKNPDFQAIPFIFLTAKSTIENIRYGMNLGADDYITKPFKAEDILAAVKIRLEKQTGIKKIYTDLQQTEAKLNHLMLYDPVTNLPNQLCLQQMFDKLVRQVEQWKESHPQNNQDILIPFILISIDRLDNIQKYLEYQYLQELLMLVIQKIKTVVTDKDILATLHEDEFLIILSPVENKYAVNHVSEKILNEFQKPLVINNQEFFVHLSICSALHPRDGKHLNQLINNAKKSILQVKELGGNQYLAYNSIFNPQSSPEDLLLETDLHYAIERNQLEVHYQPQVNLKTGKISSAEALLRWHHPERGLVSPGQFIPMAEANGLIEPIGEWVLNQVVQQIKIWRQQKMPDLRISVNLSGRQFAQPNLSQKVTETIRNSGIEPKFLEIEVTESVLIKNVQLAIKKLNLLKSLGVKISLDDFGTGYASLGYLQQFHFDYLKIDYCFVHNIHQNHKNAGIVQAIIAMAHQLNLIVIAEGVEKPEELTILKQYNCDIVQGYLFTRPLDLVRFETYIKKGSTNVAL